MENQKDISLKKETSHKDEKPPRGKKLLLAGILVILALVYGVSPIDLVPDIIPVLGWGDDVLVITAAVLNLIRQIKK